MKTVFFHDGPINKDNIGKYHNGVLNDQIINRYFFFTDKLIVATRSNLISNNEEDTIIKHDNVSFIELPNLSTVKGQILFKNKCKKKIKKIIEDVDFVIARVPSLLGGLAIAECKKQGKKFITEVVGCPWDSYRSHSILGKFIAPIEFFKLRRQVRISPLVMYVTNNFLQRRYPTKGVSIGCSDVMIDNKLNNLKERIESIKIKKSKYVIGTCGVLDVKYKGQEHVIKAIRILKNKGINIEYQLIGSGDSQRLLEIAEKQDVLKQIRIIGSIPHEEVFKWMDKLDIYIQPSDTEGLCRALVEALSRGCPCIASNVGGNSELVEPDYLFKKGDYKKLAKLIEELILNNNKMILTSKRNFEKSKDFNIKVLNEKRNTFYKKYINNYN